MIAEGTFKTSILLTFTNTLPSVWLDSIGGLPLQALFWNLGTTLTLGVTYMLYLYLHFRPIRAFYRVGEQYCYHPSWPCPQKYQYSD